MVNEHYDYLIIGGGIAGVTATETIRSRDAAGSVAILSGESHPLYSRVLLPGYLKGRIARERVFLRTAADYAAKKIDFYPDTHAERIDALRREVKTKDGDIFHFGKLLIASGGRVRPWEYTSAAEPRAYRLQTIDDADRLLGDLRRIHAPLVIGASFIALEFIDIFLEHEIVPRVLTDADRFFSPWLDQEGSAILEENFAHHGVSCLFGEKITDCQADADECTLTTAGAGPIRADAFAIGIGIEGNRDFLADSGIALGRRGVRTDAYLRTDVPDIWVAGDIAEYYDDVSGEYRTVGNWTHAVLQGRRAGLNMTGDIASFVHIPSYNITNCGMQITAIGESPAGDVIKSDEKIEDTPEPSVIVRRGGSGREYARLFVREGMIRGAFLINRPQDRIALTDLISRRINVAAYTRQLGDGAFDISPLARIK